MAIYRAVLSFPTDGVLPADEMTLSPHYAGDDAQALADRLKSNLSAFSQIGGTKPFRVRIYDAQKAPPSYPLAEASQSGTPPNSGAPRELALCLSYYSTWNRPRFRGRLYIPHLFFGGGTAARPTGTQMTAVLAWKDVLTGSLPPAHNLVVYSRVANQGYGVDHFWCDDEWDIMRSRGRKSTTRQTATFP